VSYLYQSSYYIYLIKVGLNLGEDACVVFAFFNLCLLGCQSLRETILQNYFKGLPLGVNFINVLREAFVRVGTKSVKKDSICVE